MASPRSTRSKKKPTAPHLVEPQLKYVTDATFKDWHTAISRGFQSEPRPGTLELDRRLSDNKRMFGFKVGRRWVATAVTSSAGSRCPVEPGSPRLR